MSNTHEGLALALREWMGVAEHYSVVHFAVEHGMSKEELFRMAGEDSSLSKALDYAFSVQEYKVSEGVLSGALDRTGGLKMLETYAGWKGEVNILQKNEYKQYMNEAQRRAEEVLGGGRYPVLDEDAEGEDVDGTSLPTDEELDEGL